jgi:hypothetical protein
VINVQHPFAAWRRADIDDVASILDDEHVRHWATMSDDLEAWIEQEVTESQGPSRAICLANDDRAIGRVADLDAPCRARLGAERRSPPRVKVDRLGVPRTLVVHVLPINAD